MLWKVRGLWEKQTWHVWKKIKMGAALLRKPSRGAWRHGGVRQPAWVDADLSSTCCPSTGTWSIRTLVWPPP